MEYLDQAVDFLGIDDFLAHRRFDDLRKKLNMTSKQISRIVVGAFAVLAILALIKYGEDLCLLIVGILYPGYKTLKLRNGFFESSKDRDLYLSYWVCYGLYMTLVHNLFKIILRGLPLAFLGECFFLVWLYHSSYRGADLINEKVFKKLLSKYGKYIDNQIKEIKEVVKPKDE